ncbi:hypothetical protein P154DRAFT_565134 [Amniculicola lignicola CBS 123094]|uniref:Uncharacterized protein n=1 Tax=Amniculicola lignicola CBS 123094 TaxID=1392246 RepID=A0A6A5WF43_9PLEO|nr:hypothetical protein P154DRAFT_565134 [Amniculicola lignicola CBS 123094]
MSSQTKGYRPTSIRTPTLLSLLLTIILIGLVEWACRVLSTTNDHGLLDKYLNSTESAFVERRANYGTFKRTKVITVTHSHTVLSKTPIHHIEFVRDLPPQEIETFPPHLDVFLPTKSASTPTVRSFFARDQTSSFQPTTSIQPTLAPNPDVYLQPSAPGVPFSGSFIDSKGPVATSGQYFLGAYLPTLIAVLYALPWAIICVQIQKLEGFYQLSEPQGSRAGRTITRESTSLAALLGSVFHREWAVLIATALIALSLLVTSLAAEAIAIHTIGYCDAKSKGCSGQISVFSPAARAVQAILGLIAILNVSLIVVIRRRTLCLESNPLSIAASAALIYDHDVRRDFMVLSPSITEEQLKRALRVYNYRLAPIISPENAQTIGIFKTGTLPTVNLEPAQENQCVALDSILKWVHVRQAKLTIFFVLLAGLGALIITYRYTGGDNGFERFMDSQGFGVRFLFAFIGVAISHFWSGVFQDIARTAPYCRLALGHAKAEESILMTEPSHPLTGLPQAIYHRHYVLALAATAAILSQLLTVTLSTIPFDSANAWNAYVASTWISISILLVMLLTLVVLFFHRVPDLPVQPNTLAGHMIYLTNSRLPDIFRGVGKGIEGLNYRYSLMRVRDANGVVRLTVDAENISDS